MRYHEDRLRHDGDVPPGCGCGCGYGYGASNGSGDGGDGYGDEDDGYGGYGGYGGDGDGGSGYDDLAEIGCVGDHAVCLSPLGPVVVGCRAGSISWWRARWREIAEEERIDLDEADAERLLELAEAAFRRLRAELDGEES